ncbi:hypothetical protein ABG768_012489 [Culter alburnus]|uniref:Uncharacterized protein n=1 Tax=Culter alburnus TaxID=194366 RepID=A0AAW2B1W7_CULAL
MLGNSRKAFVEQRSDEVYNRFPGEGHRRIGCTQRMWRSREVWEKSPADEEGEKSAPLHSVGFLLLSAQTPTCLSQLQRLKERISLFTPPFSLSPLQRQ